MGYDLTSKGGGKSPGRAVPKKAKARPSSPVRHTQTGGKKGTKRGSLIKVSVDVPSTVRGVNAYQHQVRTAFGEHLIEVVEEFVKTSMTEAGRKGRRNFSESMRARYLTGVRAQRFAKKVTLSLDTRDSQVAVLEYGYRERKWWDVLRHAKNLKTSKAGVQYVDIPFVSLDPKMKGSPTNVLIRHERVLPGKFTRYLNSTQPGQRLIPRHTRSRDPEIQMALRDGTRHGKPEYMEKAYPKNMRHAVNFYRVTEHSRISQRIIPGWSGVHLMSKFKRARIKLLAEARRRLQRHGV